MKEPLKFISLPGPRVFLGAETVLPREFVATAERQHAERMVRTKEAVAAAQTNSIAPDVGEIFK